MPVHGHFSKRDDRKLTMPRTGDGTPNPAGLAFQGDVLTGKLSLQQAFAQAAARVSRALTPAKRVAPKDYDPVLKSHLGSQ